MVGETHYDTLNLKPGASQNDIVESFRKLVMEYHPDRSHLPKDKAAAMFRSVFEAYSVLRDAEKRFAYDVVNGLSGDNDAKSGSNEEKSSGEEKLKEPYVFRPTNIYDYDPHINRIVILYNYHKVDERLVEEMVETYLSELGVYEDFEEHYSRNPDVFGLDAFVIESYKLEVPTILYDFESFSKRHSMSLLKLKAGVYYVESLSTFQKLDSGVEPLVNDFLRIVAESAENY